MSSLRLIELSCPVCATTFETVSPTAPATPPSAAATPADDLAALPFLVHVCRRCGYAGSVDDFAEDVELTEAVRGFVWSELAPKLGATARLPGTTLTIPGSEKYEAAARVAHWRGLEPAVVADLWIRAAWCSREEDDHEAERYYARHAAWCLADAMNFFDAIPRALRAAVAFRLGELWAVIGDEVRSLAWFERVSAEAEDPAAQSFVDEAALRLLAARHDDGAEEEA